jgi:hypothetical protein
MLTLYIQVGSVLPAVLFENVDYIIMGRVYFEVRNEISSALRLLSKDAVFCEDLVTTPVVQTSLSKGNFSSRSDKHYWGMQ